MAARLVIIHVINYLSTVIPACLPRCGLAPGAGHEVTLLRNPEKPLDAGTSPA
jgi:hypothetical protein